MAVTKTHPIKSTLKAAIDYICNPDKTDGKLLVSSFGCSAETADMEFAWTRRHAIDKGTDLGRHLIQAFEPGEVTPEEAHRIGMELAREVLGDGALFVLNFIIGGLIGASSWCGVCWWQRGMCPHHLPPDCGITVLWKCGKRPLRRWKTDIHGPMEKPPAFPQSANIVSHSFASMTVYAHSHNAYYCEYPSWPVRS